MTGGRGTFGFNAKPDAGIPSGHLNYMNHFTGAHLDCTVTAVTELTTTTAKFSGTCSPNSAASSFMAEVEDNAEAVDFTISDDDLAEIDATFARHGVDPLPDYWIEGA